MTEAVQQISRLRSLGIVLATLALTLRLVFGAGLMLAPSHSALPTLVICTGAGAVSLPADGAAKAATPGQHDPNSAEKSDHPCAFAGAAAAWTAPAAIAVAVAAFVPQALPAPPSQDLRPGRGLAAPPPPQTGPPSIA